MSKRILRRTICAFSGLLLFFLISGSPVDALEEGLFVHQIAIHPDDSKILYAATDNQGVLRSPDGGQSWTLLNNGIRSFLLYRIVIHPHFPDILYAGSYGGGLYQTRDGGRAWSEVNQGMENTSVISLIFPAGRKGILMMATPTGVYQFQESGKQWARISQGLDLPVEEYPTDLVQHGSEPAAFYLSTNRGIYRMLEKDQKWTKISGSTEIHVTALAAREDSRNLYAAIRREGFYQYTGTPGSWTRVSSPETSWINQIILDLADPKVFYLATRDRGLLKSRDGGRSWSGLNQGMTDRWVNTLLIAPKPPQRLYAGTHEKGVFESTNGGRTWKSLTSSVRLPSSLERNKSLMPEVIAQQQRTIPPPPRAFRKCNQCHGWTDDNLDDYVPTYHRVASNQRDWTRSVQAMSLRARLQPDEEKAIIRYLNTYYGMSPQGAKQ